MEIFAESGKMICSTQNDVTFDRSQYRTISTFTFVPEAESLAVPEPVDLGLPSGGHRRPRQERQRGEEGPGSRVGPGDLGLCRR